MRPPGWTRALANPRRRILLVAGAIFISALEARAQPSASEITSARRLFSEAAALREAGQWSEAAAKLREAIAIKETPGLRFHLAHCEEQMGRLLDARDDYDRADELIRRGTAAPDVAAMLEPARVALRERIPTLVVKAPADARAVGLTIDGEMIATEDLGSPIQLDPGVHTIIVSAAARDPFRLELSLKEGEDRVVDAQLAEHGAAPGPAKAPSRRPSKAPREAAQSTEKQGFGLRESILVGEGVVTAAGLGLGVAFLLQGSSKSDRIKALQGEIPSEQRCNAPSPEYASPCGELRQAVIDRHDDDVFAVTGWIIAGVGAASLVTTWLVWPSPHAAQNARLQFIPTIGGGVVRGAF
jgi:hypothetical protein